ncbi:hypothetical protein J2S43_000680 [Catenuloplanes nepalensis]|uniref:Uncharacterized protein n=1 Tax=Catenuloplanes nepalensis TaxID=587533 RepID=A0ABT9MLL2_9ACTN|nr:hypothetical protein [Catenuloplanes nepalensis]MDP9792168.1 hypothetical protein [Catenuloplanes nepalensis]
MFTVMIAGGLVPQRVAEALAALLGLPADAADVVAEGVAERDWDAAVLGTYSPLAGDVNWSLQVDFGLAVAEPPSEPETAAFLARRLRTVVVFPWTEVRPGVYWLAGPDGRHTRARVDDVEEYTDPPVYCIEAVESPVSALPGVRVEAMPEDWTGSPGR